MEKGAEKRRIVLVPMAAQGHVTPFMQLGQALQVKGFLITVAQGQFKQISSSSQHLLGFDFVTISESLPQSESKRLGSFEFLKKLNKTSEESFKECITQLLLQHGKDIACIIYDEVMYFCEVVAKELKLPSVIFSTCSATNQACCCILSKLNANKFLIDMNGAQDKLNNPVRNQSFTHNGFVFSYFTDPEMQDKVVDGLHPLKYKDLPTSGFGPLEPFLDICKVIFNTRTASAVIINTTSCLESSSLSWLQRELRIPVYPVGPLHITASLPGPSLLQEDKSCVEWLNKQKPRSVIYISLGSKANMEIKEMLEMAWGLSNSKQPFLWVIRPGSVADSEWIESLPEEVSKMVSEKGYIVKWAPQTELLAHPSVGGFWSHCGWNSILESIVEGVPMICRPFQGEQKLNATYVESVWRIGIQLGGEVERGSIERAVKRLIVEEEGAGMRERSLNLKEKLNASVRSGGSSYNALGEFVKYLNTEWR